MFTTELTVKGGLVQQNIRDTNEYIALTGVAGEKHVTITDPLRLDHGKHCIKKPCEYWVT